MAYPDLWRLRVETQENLSSVLLMGRDSSRQAHSPSRRVLATLC
jgi:hypothetical protein